MLRKSFLSYLLAAALGAMLGALIVIKFIPGVGPDTTVKPQNETMTGGSAATTLDVVGDSKAVARAVKKLQPAVVGINTKLYVRSNPLEDPFGGNPFFETPLIPKQGIGSGVIVTQNGYVLTNEHVIHGANDITVTLTDKRTFKARVAGSDSEADIAVLKIDAKNLPAAELGDSDNLDIGEFVIAVGNPYGFEHTVTLGVVSAVDRTIPERNTVYKNLIQTDAAINPGNSGGPLANLDGQVIGVNTAIIAEAQGIGFAIPINTAKKIKDELIAHGRVPRPYLGIQMQDLSQELAAYLHYAGTNGVLVSGVVPGSPAEKAGIKRGDIITDIDKQTLKDSDDLLAKVKAHKVGEAVTMMVWRKGALQPFKVTIGDRLD